MSVNYEYRLDSRLRIICGVVHVLYLVGFGLIGVIIAHVKRADAVGTVWEGHFTYAIRTFWLGFLAYVIALPIIFFSLPSFVGHSTSVGAASSGWGFISVGIIILAVVGLWSLIRAIVGLLRVLGDEPVRNPETLFF